MTSRIWRRWDEGVSWRSVRVSGPTQEPIDVEYMCDQVLRVVNDTADGEFISRQIAAARGVFEAETGRAAMSQTWQLLLDQFPSSADVRPAYLIELPRPPLIAVTSITYLDDDGATQTLLGSPAEYRVFPSGEFSRGGVAPLVGETWPVVTSQPDAVTITYTAGYSAAEDMPELYKAGIGLLVAELYKQRSLSGQSSEAVLKTNRFWKRVY